MSTQDEIEAERPVHTMLHDFLDQRAAFSHGPLTAELLRIQTSSARTVPLGITPHDCRVLRKVGPDDTRVNSQNAAQKALDLKMNMGDSRQCKAGFHDWYLDGTECRYLLPEHVRLEPSLAGSDKWLSDLPQDALASDTMRDISRFASQPGAHPAPDVVEFENCPSCSGFFQYLLSDGQDPVTVIKGAPDPDARYRAVSYVWGDAAPCIIRCKSCSSSTDVPLRDGPGTLHKILRHAGPGSSVWLDCLSIAQSDPSDVKAILPNMGSIYKKAESVLVILPSADSATFELLATCFVSGSVMLRHMDDFAHNRDVPASSASQERPLSSWCAEFFKALQALEDGLGQSAYFQRAWTFQEWALARDLDVCHVAPGALFRLPRLKSVVIDAACLWARYIMLVNQYAEIRCGMTRAAAPAVVARVQRLFPHEDFWLAHDEIDREEREFQIGAANISGVEHALGIREEQTEPANPSPEEERGATRDRLRRRVTTMLGAFSSSQRQARYPADLVACWASMANIHYEYSKEDTVEEALAKVIPALRAMGIQVFNFFVSTGAAPLTIDQYFMHLTGRYTQQTFAQGALQPSLAAPAFTGLSDTIDHISRSMQAPYRPPDGLVPIPAEEQALLRRVRGAVVHECVFLAGTDLGSLADTWAKIIYGMDESEGLGMFMPPATWVPKLFRTLAQRMPHEVLRRSLCIVRIPVSLSEDGPGSPARYLWTWVICRTPLAALPHTSYWVAREPLNGTLVLVQDVPRGMGPAQSCPLGYLTVLDHRAGAFLVRTTAEGVVDVKLPGLIVPGFSYPLYEAERALRCQVDLDDNSMIPSGAKDDKEDEVVEGPE
ncbi:uncharacterized protein DNG_04535 [Cephalotrichum gorgonifer]|uniref:Heterokaryon incompatibility domain-containing protein n=1 Tax=Cephalotrichum gorgonifer TaxID=2041049 RepID=A0AAE8SVB6_9PEZI|nr:uncharacterized protein DNG_04535 [Cephalotrichum gorgonifer]